jgi:hypothetical protein
VGKAPPCQKTDQKVLRFSKFWENVEIHSYLGKIIYFFSKKLKRISDFFLAKRKEALKKK